MATLKTHLYMGQVIGNSEEVCDEHNIIGDSNPQHGHYESIGLARTLQS